MRPSVTRIICLLTLVRDLYHFYAVQKKLFDIGLPRKRINEPILNPDDLGVLECDENRFAISLDSIYNDYNRFISN